MSRTIIGQLIIKLQEQGARAAAKSLTSELDSIERRARALGRGGWGASFNSQLDKLKLTPLQAQAIKSSWDRLPNDINGALKKADVGKWRTSVLGHFSAIEAKATGLTGVLSKLAGSPAFQFLAGYGAMRLGMGGVNAASEQARQEANAKFAGLPEEDRARIKAEAEAKSKQYRIGMADFYQVLKEASLSMPSTDAALEVSDTMARAYVVLQSLFGKDGAIHGLYALNKALDNINLNQNPEDYKKAIGLYMKAQQVLGADLSPEAMAQAIKYSRAAGKVFSPDFLFTWMAASAAETGGSDAGNKLRANFDQFIGGRASKEAKARLRQFGLMDKSDELIQSDLYQANPTVWAHDVLLPALKGKGVDVDNQLELVRVLTRITNNRLSSDELASGLLNFEQRLRLVETYFPRAMGLDAADEVQSLDPFASGNAFVASLESLAGAMGEHVFPTIIPGLNAISDGIFNLAEMVRKLPEGWGLGAAVGGAALGGLGIYKGGKGLLGAISGGFGLQTSAASLQTAAVMLQEAAIAQGGGSVAGGVGAGGKPGAKTTDDALKQSFPLLAPVVAEAIGNWFESTFMGGRTPEQQEVLNGALGRVFGRIERAIYGDGGLGSSGSYLDHEQANGGRKSRDSFAGQEGLKAATDELAGALSIKARPEVDTSSIDAATAKAKALAAALKEVGQWASRAVQSADATIANAYSDYGVEP